MPRRAQGVVGRLDALDDEGAFEHRYVGLS